MLAWLTRPMCGRMSSLAKSRTPRQNKHSFPHQSVPLSLSVQIYSSFTREFPTSSGSGFKPVRFVDNTYEIGFSVTCRGQMSRFRKEVPATRNHAKVTFPKSQLISPFRLRSRNTEAEMPRCQIQKPSLYLGRQILILTDGVWAEVEVSGEHLRLFSEHNARGVQASVYNVKMKTWIAPSESVDDIEQGQGYSRESC
jgi:hypothetical protein